MNRQRGDISVLELMILVAIVGIIASIALPALIDAKERPTKYLASQGISAVEIQQKIADCEKTLPRNKKCIVTYEVKPE